MKMTNNMPKVAQIFNKEIDEEFQLKFREQKYTASFNTFGLKVRGLYYERWNDALVELLVGQAEIIPENKKKEKWLFWRTSMPEGRGFLTVFFGKSLHVFSHCFFSRDIISI